MSLVTTSRGYEWAEKPQDLMAALIATANPVARMDENSIGSANLVEADVVAIAGTVPPPTHLQTTITGAAVSIPAATCGVVKTVAGAYALTERVLIDQPVVQGAITLSPFLRLHAFIDSTTSLIIMACNMDGGAAHSVPLGLVLSMVRI
jgi:hypothetical protein